MIPLLEAVPWFVWSVVANFAIATTEYMNRTGGFTHAGEAFLRTGPLIFLAQVGLFYAWRDAPSFMYAWAIFTAGNIALRVLSAHYLVGERLTLSVGFGVGLVILDGGFVGEGVGASS